MMEEEALKKASRPSRANVSTRFIGGTGVDRSSIKPPKKTAVDLLANLREVMKKKIEEVGI